MLKKALIYLGLGPDEEYEQYDDFAPTAAGSSDDADDGPGPSVRGLRDNSSSAVRPSTVRAVPPFAGSASVRVVPAPKGSGGAVSSPVAETPEPQQATSAIRIVETTTAKPHAITPTSFNEAQGIGDRFKSGQPVIVNLQAVERDLRRRLVDFASGLCYALGGKMDRVADQVYLLIPADVEVSSDDARSALD